MADEAKKSDGSDPKPPNPNYSGKVYNPKTGKFTAYRDGKVVK